MGSDGADVVGDEFAGASVAACGGLDQTSVVVDQGDGEAVELGFGDEGEVFAVEQFDGATAPVEQLFGVEGVAQAEHAFAVFDQREGASGRRADAQGGAVVDGQFGEAPLQRLQFAEEGVVGGVGDFGLIERVVEVLMTGQAGAQLFDPQSGVAALLVGVHGR